MRATCSFASALLRLADIRRSDVRALMAERAANGSAANRIRNIVAPLRANILLVARVAGHSDPAVTLRVYAHLFRDGLSEAAEKYDPLGVAAAR